MTHGDHSHPLEQGLSVSVTYMESNTGGSLLYVALPAIPLIYTSPSVVHPKRQSWGSRLIHIQSQGPSRVSLLFHLAAVTWQHQPRSSTGHVVPSHVLFPSFQEDPPTAPLWQDLSRCGAGWPTTCNHPSSAREASGAPPGPASHKPFLNGCFSECRVIYRVQNVLDYEIRKKETTCQFTIALTSKKTHTCHVQI